MQLMKSMLVNREAKTFLEWNKAQGWVVALWFDRVLEKERRDGI